MYVSFTHTHIHTHTIHIHHTHFWILFLPLHKFCLSRTRKGWTAFLNHYSVYFLVLFVTLKFLFLFFTILGVPNQLSMYLTWRTWLWRKTEAKKHHWGVLVISKDPIFDGYYYWSFYTLYFGFARQVRATAGDSVGSLLPVCDVFRALINSLACWCCTSSLGLVLFQAVWCVMRWFFSLCFRLTQGCPWRSDWPCCSQATKPQLFDYYYS